MKYKHKEIFLVPNVKTFNILSQVYSYKNKIFESYDEAEEFLSSKKESGSIFKLVAKIEVEKVHKVIKYDD